MWLEMAQLELMSGGIQPESSHGAGKGKGKPNPWSWKGKPRKGSGKGKGKSKGKRPSKGKGKGYGTGYYGCYSEKTLVGSFGESKMTTTPPRGKVVHFKLDHDDSPVLPLGAKQKPVDATTQDETDPASSSVAKTLDFTFATGVYIYSLSYHTVLGKRPGGL